MPGLNVDLTVKESMMSFLQNYYNSDFARTMEVEEAVKTKKEVANLTNELKKAKKTITFLRDKLTKDETVTTTLNEECINGAKEYRSLNSKYRSSKRTIRELEEQLKSNRELLSKITSENLVIKQSSMTKAAMASVEKQSDYDEIMFACEKCEFISNNEHELQRHAHTNHSEAKAEVHLKEKSKALHKCTKCPAKFRLQEQFSNHMESHEFHCFYKECGCQTETEEQMIRHIDDYHMIKVRETDEQVTETPEQKRKVNKECRYFKQGRCTKGDECLFKHFKSTYKCEKCSFEADKKETLEEHIKNKHKERQTSNTLCKNGASCHFKAQNRCKFFHNENGNKNHTKKDVQEKTSAKEINYNKKQLWCKFQDDCTKTDCKHKHFEKRAPKNPTLGQWLVKK